MENIRIQRHKPKAINLPPPNSSLRHMTALFEMDPEAFKAITGWGTVRPVSVVRRRHLDSLQGLTRERSDW